MVHRLECRNKLESGAGLEAIEFKIRGSELEVTAIELPRPRLDFIQRESDGQLFYEGIC